MIEVARYKEKYFAVYENGELLAVCVYRKGAYTIKGRLDALQALVEQLKAQGQPVAEVA